MEKCFIKLCVIVALILSVCDWNSEKTPDSYLNTEWKSEDPYLKLTVSKFGTIYSEMKIDGEIKEVNINFSSGNKVAVCEASFSEEDENYITGTFNLYKNKCVITIQNNENGILLNSIKKITLIRRNTGLISINENSLGFVIGLIYVYLAVFKYLGNYPGLGAILHCTNRIDIINEDLVFYTLGKERAVYCNGIVRRTKGYIEGLKMTIIVCEPQIILYNERTKEATVYENEKELPVKYRKKLKQDREYMD